MKYNKLTYELINHFKIYNSVTYLVLFFLFLSISLVFIMPIAIMSQQSAALFIIIIPFAQINYTSAIFQQDYKDGTLELMMATTNTDNIVTIKFIALSIISLSVILLFLPLFCLLYSIHWSTGFRLACLYSLIFLYVNIFIILLSSIQIYFNSACNFIAILIFPLITPAIICGVLGVFDAENFVIYFTLLLGLNLILIPIILMMSSYLIRNIYHI